MTTRPCTAAPSAARPVFRLRVSFLLGLLCCAAILTYGTAPSEAGTVSRKLIAAIPPDFAQTYFRDPVTGQPAGFAVDVLNEVARRAGFEVEYTYGSSWDVLEELVLAGTADLVPNLTIDEKRMKRFIFTHPVETLQISLIARASDTARDRILPGMKIGVMKGSSVEHALKDRTEITLVPHAGLQQLVLELLSGRVDLIMTAVPNVLKLARDADIEERIRIIDQSGYEAKRGMALRPDSQALRDQLNPIIYQFVTTPEYQKLYQKWWGKPLPFWTTKRVGWTIAGAVSAWAAVFLAWRYRENKQSRKRLAAALEQLEDKHGKLLEQTAERKRVETALRESEEIFRCFMEHSPIHVFFKDEQIRAVRLSSNYESLLGRPLEDLLGKSMDDLFPSDLAKSMIADDQRILEEGKAITVEEELGGRFYETTKFPIQLEGRPAYLAGFTIDITERKLAAEEKARLQDQLFQAQKVESVGRLAGGVAHDFNNMLGVILGHTELALRKIDPSHPVWGHLEQIDRAGGGSAETSRQLLAFARKQTISPKVLDLNATLEPMLKMIRRLIGEDIDIVWKPGSDLGNIKMDPSQVDQIIANLATNARDAIGGVGHVTIETGAEVLDELYCKGHPGFVPGEYVTLCVSDDGCGIERERMSSIFEPFFTTKEMGKGTGLGLATVYGIVKQNGGFINVYSEPGHGATFKIYLPRAADNALQVTQSPPATTLRGSETILVVEDEEASLALLQSYLESMGYKVLAANTPKAAITLAEEETIDLLLTDVVMPGMNGRQLAERLTAAKPRLRCMFMSGYTANVIAHRGVLDEGVSFLQKPYSLAELGEKIRQVLDS